MNERLVGKVAAIVDSKEVVVNLGEDSGVELGTRFAILTPNRVMIEDPDSGEKLGELEIPKSYVKVVRVEPRYCIARTFRTIKASPGIFKTFPSGNEAREEALSVAWGVGLRSSLTPEEKIVSIGDPVREVFSGEYSEEA